MNLHNYFQKLYDFSLKDTTKILWRARDTILSSISEKPFFIRNHGYIAITLSITSITKHAVNSYKKYKIP